ncbi:MAG: BadF/BadG/BcrA/BcrD ATPase family protein [Opitutaceae bacterium]
MSPPYKIGVDGGGTKTECILVDARGEIVARHLAPGSNPSIVGPEQARLILTDALCALLDAARSQLSTLGSQLPAISSTHLYMAGSRSFWTDLAATLPKDFGSLHVADDSLPILELATLGRPGLVLHSGTGSFVAARAPDGSIHYAGGLGWRFGDPGSGYDLGRRAIARALLELQGWSTPTRLGPTVRDHTQLLPRSPLQPAPISRGEQQEGDSADAGAITRFFYQHAEPNRQIAALAPAVLRLATEGDSTAQQLVLDSTSELLALATRVAAKLFPDTALDTLPAGLSGPILTYPVVTRALAPRSPLPLTPVAGLPIDGVRRLLARSQ